MVNSFSDGKGRLVEPPFGSYVDSWNQPCNSNFGLTDALISGTTTLNTSSLTPSSPFWTLVFQDFDTSATPWLNPLAGQNLRIVVTGALAYNATIFIPQNFPGLWIVDNQTTGGFAVGIKTTNPSSSGVVITQGYMTMVFCDGTNVNYADLGVSAAPAGTIFPFAGVVSPGGYLPCDGAAVSRTTYQTLFAAIGTTWGAGNGATTFNVPDLRDMFIRGAGSSPVGTLEQDTLKSHTHTATVTDLGHLHGVPQGDRIGGGTGDYASGDDYTTQIHAYVNSQTATTGISVTNANTGDAETRPVNKRVLYVIKT